MVLRKSGAEKENKMDQVLNDYLEKTERSLRALPASERIDIVKEIKSEMAELSEKGISPEGIMERLGSPKELAKGYLGDAIVKSRGFSLRRLAEVICFYGYVGIGGIFVLPITSILAVSFMLCGILCPIAGLIKLFGKVAGIDVPWVTFQFGSWTAGTAFVFPLSIVMGAVFFLLGRAFWKLSVFYVKSVAKGSRRLADD